MCRNTGVGLDWIWKNPSHNLVKKAQVGLGQI